jgi:hypothetical protein
MPGFAGFVKDLTPKCQDLRIYEDFPKFVKKYIHV